MDARRRRARRPSCTSPSCCCTRHSVGAARSQITVWPQPRIASSNRYSASMPAARSSSDSTLVTATRARLRRLHRVDDSRGHGAERSASCVGRMRSRAAVRCAAAPRSHVHRGMALRVSHRQRVHRRRRPALGQSAVRVRGRARPLRRADAGARAADEPVGDDVRAAVASSATAHVRIFTPGFEMPFAGHPTLGTAHVVRALRGGDQRHARDEGRHRDGHARAATRGRCAPRSRRRRGRSTRRAPSSRAWSACPTTRSATSRCGSTPASSSS